MSFIQTSETHEAVSHNVLLVTALTSGYQGGDSGHGGWAEVTFTNGASTNMAVAFVPEGQTRDPRKGHQHADEISILMRGDAEIATFIECMEFAVSSLRRQLDMLREEGKTSQREEQRAIRHDDFLTRDLAEIRRLEAAGMPLDDRLLSLKRAMARPDWAGE